MARVNRLGSGGSDARTGLDPTVRPCVPFKSKGWLKAENTMLRQQVIVLRRYHVRYRF